MRKPFPLPADPLTASLFVRFIYRLNRWLLHRLFRIEVQGRHHIPAQGPYVLVANHISRYDPLLIMATFALQPRIWFLAAAQVTTDIAWRRSILRRTGAILPFNSNDRAAGRQILQGAEHVLARGGVVGIFPEGRVGPETGHLQSLRPGASSLALRLGAPMLPVTIVGAGDVYLKKHLQVIIGPAFWPPAGVSKQAATAAVRSALQACLEQARPTEELPVKRWRWLNRVL